MKGYMWTYLGAVAAAGVAAFMIKDRWAYTIVAAMGTMISDPDGMADSAAGWSTGELETLSGELDALKTALQENGTWEGEAFTAFEDIHGRFKESIANLDEVRNSTGEAVDSTASFYAVGAIVCAGIAAVMVAWALVVQLAQVHPTTFMAAKVRGLPLGQKLINLIKGVLSKHKGITIALTAVIGMAVFQSRATGQVFPGLEAMPASEMDMGAMTFTSDGMTYDENVASLMPEVDETMAQDTGGISI
ncbi:hypothetical protein FAF44_06480 [Nonomuraea sp. MG754425]|uniref:WXG100 family type VII secretion target n=1 Tax=Nonomuraea sp. MG754425 TaxID=2570319 RepID=UPI001F2B17F1|nr:WXG100 family type VII secretion target [Nonomuraea sp. MG754425]MCF6468049.1 hypothetical protein [Nonomuraea sp. MG754425]